MLKIYSDKKPPDYFYHIQPRNKALTLVRFCENQIESENGWQYDEHTVEVMTRSNMDEYIRRHYTELKAEALRAPSMIEKISANLDYISMMIGVDIPTEGGEFNG